MKSKYYAYDSSLDAKELIDSTFGSNEIEAKIEEGFITLETLDEPIVIGYEENNLPLTVDGHTFELLRDYWVEFTVGDKVFSTKHLDHTISKAELVMKAVTAWVSSTKTSKQPFSSLQRAKVKEEKALLKSLLAKQKAASKASE